MKQVFDFIDNFTFVQDSVLDFIWQFMTNMIKIFNFMGEVVTLAGDLITTMPIWLQAFAFCTVAVAVFFQIFGRSQGGSKSDD